MFHFVILTLDILIICFILLYLHWIYLHWVRFIVQEIRFMRRLNRRQVQYRYVVFIEGILCHTKHCTESGDLWFLKM